MSATLYLEGGGDSKDLQSRCCEGFRKLLERCGLGGRMPRLVACGGRQRAFGDFRTAHGMNAPKEFIAMLIDSEEPVADIEKTWEHLGGRDKWVKPKGAQDEQVLLMTTCMETWIITDRATLTKHYGDKLREPALPPLVDMENRSRQTVQDKLVHAARKCSNAFAKGKRSFEVLARLNPEVLHKHLPSFVRIQRILRKKL